MVDLETTRVIESYRNDILLSAHLVSNQIFFSYRGSPLALAKGISFRLLIEVGFLCILTYVHVT